MWRRDRINGILNKKIELFVFLLLFLFLATYTTSAQPDEILVFTTNPYFKPIIEEIGGEYVNVSSIKTSSDLHSFSLSINEAELIEKADLIFLTNSYDLGFERSIKNSHPNRTVDFDDYKRNGAKLKDFNGYLNPHGYWLNLNNTISIAKTIADELSDLKSDKKSYFQQNFYRFKTKIEFLREEIREVSEIEGQKVNCVALIPALAYIIDNSGLNTSAIMLEEEDLATGKNYIEIERKLENSEYDCIVAPKSMKDSKIGDIARQLSEDTKKPLIYVDMFLGNKSIEAMHLINFFSFKDLKSENIQKNPDDGLINLLYLVIVLQGILILILWWKK